LIEGIPGCDLEGPVLYRGPGYLEGKVIAAAVGREGGEEEVYDFATMQKTWFKYDGFPGLNKKDDWLTGGLSDGVVGVNYMEYIGTIQGFPSSGDIVLDYSGEFNSFSVGLDGVIVSGGFVDFWSPDGKIRGRNWYIGAGLSLDPLPLADVDRSRVFYEATTRTEDYAHNGRVDRLQQLLTDISDGNSIFPITPGYDSKYRFGEYQRANARQTAIRMAKVYDEIHSAYE